MTVHIEQVKDVPEPMRRHIRSEVYWNQIGPGLLALSDEVYYIHDSGTPLMLIGAMRIGFLTGSKEIWLFSSDQLNFLYLPYFRDQFHHWLSQQRGTIYGVGDTPQNEKFLKWMGFAFCKKVGGKAIYEAVK